MNEDKENGGIGSAVILALSGLGATSLICGTALCCSEEKTERKRIDLKETKLYCRSQERIEIMKEFFKHRNKKDE